MPQGTLHTNDRLPLLAYLANSSNLNTGCESYNKPDSNMLSFFNSKKATIDFVKISDFGWAKSRNEESIIQWINPEQSVAISINFFNLRPDIPLNASLDSLRNFYRTSISQVNGGLIEVDLVKINQISAVKTIFKLPQKPSGITYLASITIPFENCSFVLKVQCAEVGTAGMRDSFVANKLIENNELTIEGNRISNWFLDPYEPAFSKGTLMNKSEQEIYDKLFPNHPLTVARTIISKIESTAVFHPGIKKLNSLIK